MQAQNNSGQATRWASQRGSASFKANVYLPLKLVWKQIYMYIYIERKRDRERERERENCSYSWIVGEWGWDSLRAFFHFVFFLMGFFLCAELRFKLLRFGTRFISLSFLLFVIHSPVTLSLVTQFEAGLVFPTFANYQSEPRYFIYCCWNRLFDWSSLRRGDGGTGGGTGISPKHTLPKVFHKTVKRMLIKYREQIIYTYLRS